MFSHMPMALQLQPAQQAAFGSFPGVQVSGPQQMESVQVQTLLPSVQQSPLPAQLSLDLPQALHIPSLQMIELQQSLSSSQDAPMLPQQFVLPLPHLYGEQHRSLGRSLARPMQSVAPTGKQQLPSLHPAPKLQQSFLFWHGAICPAPQQLSLLEPPTGLEHL